MVENSQSFIHCGLTIYICSLHLRAYSFCLQFEFLFDVIVRYKWYPVKRRFLQLNGHNFLSINILNVLKKLLHFSSWGPRYWNTREMHWRPIMTFLEDILKNDHLRQVIFPDFEKPYPWNWQIVNQF